MSLLHLRRGIGTSSCPLTPVECVAFVQLTGFQIRVMWQLGRITSHVPASFEYLRDGQLEMDGYPEEKASLVGMA